MHDVSTGVRAKPEVGTGNAKALLDHRSAPGDPRGGVVLRVWDKRGADAEDELGVNLDMGKN